MQNEVIQNKLARIEEYLTKLQEITPNEAPRSKLRGIKAELRRSQPAVAQGAKAEFTRLLGDINLRFRPPRGECNSLSLRFFLTLENIFKNCICVVFEFGSVLLS